MCLQHGAAVVGGEVVRACPVKEGGVAAVGHVVGAGLRVCDVIRQGEGGVVERRRGGVNNEVVSGRGSEVFEAACRERHGGVRLLCGDDGGGFGGGAVGDMQAGRAGGAKGGDDATRRTARAEDEDAGAGEADAVFLQGEAEAAAVGVVAAEFAVFLPQGIDGFGEARVGAGLCAEAVGGFFVGQGDVEAAPAVGKELGNDGGEVFCFGEDAVVAQVDAVRLREGGVDVRRAGMGDGVADYGAAVGCGWGVVSHFCGAVFAISMSKVKMFSGVLDWRYSAMAA